MNHRKDNKERRSFKRFRAKEGAFAVLRPQCTKLGQIVDISEGGLAFHYASTGNQKNGEHEVDIFKIKDQLVNPGGHTTGDVRVGALEYQTDRRLPAHAVPSIQ